MKLEKWYIIQQLILEIYQPGYDESWDKYLTDDLFEFLCDKLGEEQIVDKIIKHPFKGYTVKYADEISEKMVYERHIENKKEKVEEIKKLRNETNITRRN